MNEYEISSGQLFGSHNELDRMALMPHYNYAIEYRWQGGPIRNGRCRMHGGKATGAPKGNRNALKHGTV